MRDKFIKQWTETYSEQIDARVDKRAKMLETEMNPYKTGLRSNVSSTELRSRHADHSKEDLAGMTTDYAIAGRAMLVRDFGKAAFIDCDDGEGRMQIYISKNDLSESFAVVDLGGVIARS